MARTINAAGLALERSFENCKLEAYRDLAGIWTIGWGHTGPEVTEGLTWTQDQADAAQAQDNATAEWQVDRHTCDVPTSDNQFSAMVSFAYNAGVSAFIASSVLIYHRLKQYDRAGAAFLLWNKAHVDGVLVEVAGLTRRRAAERDLYLTPDAA